MKLSDVTPETDILPTHEPKVPDDEAKVYAWEQISFREQVGEHWALCRRRSGEYVYIAWDTNVHLADLSKGAK